MVKFAKAYDEYVRCPTKVEGVSLTKQSDKDACDINLIVARYMGAGYNPDIMPAPMYGEDVVDLSNSPDYQSAMNVVAQNNSMFERLPSKVRLQFHNSPAEWIDSLISEHEAKAEISVSSVIAPQGGTSSPAEQKDASASVTAPGGAV